MHTPKKSKRALADIAGPHTTHKLKKIYATCIQDLQHPSVTLAASIFIAFKRAKMASSSGDRFHPDAEVEHLIEDDAEVAELVRVTASELLLAVRKDDISNLAESMSARDRRR